MASTMNRTQGKLFQRMTLSYTVLVVLVLALLVPLYIRTLSIVKEQSLRDNYSVLRNAFYILKNRIDQSNQGIMYAYGDPLFKNIAVLPKRLDPIDYYKLRNAQGFIASLIKTDDLIRDYLIYFPGNGITFTNGRVFDSVESAYGLFLKYEGLDLSAWLSEMNRSSIRDLWPERQLQRYDDTGQRKTLTYAMTVPPGSTSQTRVIAAFILDKERLLELLLTPESRKNGWLYLEDLSGEVLMRSNFTQDPLALGDDGISEFKIDGVQTSVVSMTDLTLGLRLVAGFPIGMFTAAIVPVRRLIILYIGGAFALGAIIAIGLGYRQSKPWRTLAAYAENITRNIGGDAADGSGAMPSEYARIRDALDNMGRSRSELDSTLQEQQQLLRISLLERALRSGIHGDNDLKAAEYYLDYLPQAYHVAVLRIDYPLAERTEKEDREILRAVLLKTFQESFKDGITVHPSDVSDFVLLIDSGVIDRKGRGGLETAFRAAFRDAADKFGAEALCAISLIHRGIGELSTAFEEASSSIRTAGLLNGSRIRWHEQRRTDAYGLDLDIGEEQRLFKLITAGESRTAIELLERIIRRNLEGSPDESRARQVYYTLRGTISRAAAEAVPDSMPPLADYDGNCVLGDLFQKLSERTLELSSRVEQRRRSHNVLLKEKILSFIDGHFHDASLYAPSVAQEFHISTKYLSNFIKEQTGLTFGDHVEKKRLELAVRLLETSGLTLAEIAGKSGFASTNTFYKNFKRIYGTSPSAWRETKQSYQ